MKKCGKILMGVLLAAVLLLTACTSKAQKAMEKVELGQKYLTEQNYTEAVASFTEVSHEIGIFLRASVRFA